MSLKASARILIVDDISSMRIIIKGMLGKLGFTNVVEASDGDPAWKILNQSAAEGAPFDLVISDWNMPMMTGLDLIKNVRSHANLKATPFILIVEGQSQAEIGKKSGTEFCLIKPFNLNDLKAYLDRI